MSNKPMTRFVEVALHPEQKRWDRIGRKMLGECPTLSLYHNVAQIPDHMFSESWLMHPTDFRQSRGTPKIVGLLPKEKALLRELDRAAPGRKLVLAETQEVRDRLVFKLRERRHSVAKADLHTDDPACNCAERIAHMKADVIVASPYCILAAHLDEFTTMISFEFGWAGGITSLTRKAAALVRYVHLVYGDSQQKRALLTDLERERDRHMKCLKEFEQKRAAEHAADLATDLAQAA